MKIDGREIAATLLAKLQKEVNDLKNKGITPHLAVILVGNDQASQAYVKQKKLKGEQIGMIVSIHEFDDSVAEEKLLDKLQELNSDPTVHGIIVQQPLPKHVNAQKLVEATKPEKDVDGFHPSSSFTPPIAEAAIEILKSIDNPNDISEWLKAKNIVIIGKGETGGTPIRNKLESLGAHVIVVDSKTENPQDITKKADIIVSCVGRPNIVTKDMIKEDVILLSVGMFRGKDGKLHGDYEEDKIRDVAGYYTPVPGGVGPVNVAELLKNVKEATKNV